MILFDSSHDRPNWQYLAAIGAVPGASRVAPLGVNPSVSAAPADVWAGAAVGSLNGYDHKLIPWLSAAIAMEVVSSSASDAAAGSGARTVIVSYINAQRQAKTVTLSLNGTTAVAIPEPVLRVNTVAVASVGTYSSNNVGNISIRAAGGGGITYGYIAAGAGLSQTCQYSVPAGMSLDVWGINFCALGAGGSAQRYITVTICIQNAGGRILKGFSCNVSTDVPYLQHASAIIPITTVAEQNDIWVRCESISATVGVTAAFIGVLR